MMGFILNKEEIGGELRNLKPAEHKALHECLVWSRDGTNNKVLQMFGTIFDNFRMALGTLMGKIRGALPEGSTACRIRASARETHRPTTGTLRDTLGEERVGMVFLDPAGMPLKYDQLQIFKDCCPHVFKACRPVQHTHTKSMAPIQDIVGTTACRIKVDYSADKSASGWHPTGLTLDTDQHAGLDDKWRKDLCLGADHVLKESWVTANDPHYE